MGTDGRFARLGGLVLLLSTLGCAKKPLQQGGGSGTIGPNVDGGGDGGARDGTATTDLVVVDGPWDAPFAGRRSFVVTSNVTVDGRPPFSHKFTMTVDLDSQLATLGPADTGSVVSVLQPTAGGVLHLTSVTFPLPYVPPCPTYVTYDDLSFTIDASGRLSGSGRGQVWIYEPERLTNHAATPVLTGVPDGEQPSFDLEATGDPADPWLELSVLASEPLRTEQARPMLRSAGGDAIALEGATTTVDMYIGRFWKPSHLLRFAEPYRITFDGITDLAGNPAPSSSAIAFTTRAAPPLVTADGFESVASAMVGGAQVLSGAGAPTLSGARSLYIPPATSLGRTGLVTQFAVRVPMPPGGTKLRFDYRSVNPDNEFRGAAYFVIGSVGGAIGAAVPESDERAPTTPAMIGQTQVLLGPLRTLTTALPADAHDEVVIARVASQSPLCSHDATPAVPGLIIDDLRAE